MSTYDVAIVGAGIVGAACADALSRESLNVLLIDAGGIATGTTAAGMGHIVVMDDSAAQLALTRYSQVLWNELASELPPSCEFEPCGTIWVAADEAEMLEARRKQGVYSSHGLYAELLDSRALRDAEPHLAEGLAGGLLVAGDSVVYQLAAARYLVERATGRGAGIMTGAVVTSIRSGRVVLVGGQRIDCGVVINAAGAAAARLTPQLKLKERKGHLVITERYPDLARHQLIELGYLRSAHGSEAASVAFNVQPRKTGQVLLGSSRQFDAKDGRVEGEILRRMTTRAFRFMPRLAGLQAVRVWTGFRPATPDNLPYVGSIPGHNNVYAAAGHEGLGITTSLATAAILTDRIMEREPAIPCEPYLPGRVTC